LHFLGHFCYCEEVEVGFRNWKFRVGPLLEKWGWKAKADESIVWTPMDFQRPKATPLSDWDVYKTEPKPYRPFRYGPYHVTMGLRRMEWDQWIGEYFCLLPFVLFPSSTLSPFLPLKTSKSPNRTTNADPRRTRQRVPQIPRRQSIEDKRARRKMQPNRAPRLPRSPRTAPRTLRLPARTLSHSLCLHAHRHAQSRHRRRLRHHGHPLGRRPDANGCTHDSRRPGDNDGAGRRAVLSRSRECSAGGLLEAAG
jgi:hypothetical protein